MMNSVEHVDDPELVRETLDGSPLAFGRIVRLYQRDVRMVVSKWIRCPAAADDVAQETFVAAYENLNRFDNQHSLRSWLIGIAKNKAKLHLRSETRRKTHELTLLQNQIQQWKAEEIDLLEETNDQGALTRCLEKLAPESKKLVDNYYFNGKTLESIARESDRSGGSLRMVLLRIRKALAKCIRGQHQA